MKICFYSSKFLIFIFTCIYSVCSNSSSDVHLVTSNSSTEINKLFYMAQH